jgi:hypothetical protein
MHNGCAERPTLLAGEVVKAVFRKLVPRVTARLFVCMLAGVSALPAQVTP